MQTSDHPPQASPDSARARVSARRQARVAGTWRSFYLAIALLIAMVVTLILALGWRRADQTLATIQQQDPRLNRPTRVVTPLPAATAAPNATALPTQAPSTPVPTPPNALREPVNILLIGVDKRPDPNEGVRSDTLIVVHLDSQAGWVSMLSIPRDTVTLIPNVGWAKINAAYTYGYMNAEALYGVGTDPDAAGGALAAETVENLLKIRVDYTAEVDFRGFERLVDSVGGLIIDVPAPLMDSEYPTENYGVERLFIPPGLQVMNGRTALAYARSRHGSNDFDRGRRQQQVLRALLDQVRTRGLLENATLLPRWAEVLSQNIRTTLPIRDLGMINGLANLARELRGDRIAQFSVNPNDVAIEREDGSDIYWNKTDLAELVAKWQAGPRTTATEQARIQVLNGAAVQGVAGQVTEYLRGRGFTLAEAATAPLMYDHTTIIDYTDRPRERQRLADELGITPQFIQKVGTDSPPQGYNVDIVVIIGKDYKVEWTGN